ncbi:MAG: phage terminase large subunit family protein [Planctomycetes bacterium]|nr:phage terminase large subunit family protein [Planctomycetota bacterium]
MKKAVEKSLFPAPLALQAEEREILEPRDRLTVSQWAEQRRILNRKTSNHSGKWSHFYTPFQIEPMDAFSDIGTRQITEMKCFQAAGTELGNNCLGWVVDESPGPALVVMPTERDAGRRVGTRLKQMFESTPSLRRHLPGGDLDAINIGKETILDNMIIYLGWSGSPAALADNPCCYVFLDEVGKFPTRSGKEADPVSLAKDRQRTFYARSKLVVVSTPVVAGDLIDREFKAGDQRSYWVKCPFCGYRFVLRWEHVDLDKDSARKLLSVEDYASGKCSRYFCPHCEKQWTEQDRWQAVTAGIWAPRDCTVEGDRIIGKVFSNPHKSFRITSFMLYPTWMDATRLAVKWAQAQIAKHAGDIGPLQDMINGEFAEPFEEMGKETDEDKVKRNVTDVHDGTVPLDCRMLTAGADYHEDETGNVRIDYEIRGWGPALRNYVITAGSVDCWELLEDAVLMRTFPWSEECKKEELAVGCCFADSGFHPDVVYTWCRKFQNICFPTKGKDNQRTPLTYSDLDRVVSQAKARTRRSRARNFQGMLLIHIDTNFFKSLVINWAETPVGQPGSTGFYTECPQWYFDELCAEHKVPVRRGRTTVHEWVPKQGSAGSHGLDIAVGSTAAGYYRKAFTIKDTGDKQRPAAAAGQRRTVARRVGRVKTRS